MQTFRLYEFAVIYECGNLSLSNEGVHFPKTRVTICSPYGIDLKTSRHFTRTSIPVGFPEAYNNWLRIGHYLRGGFTEKQVSKLWTWLLDQFPHPAHAHYNPLSVCVEAVRWTLQQSMSDRHLEVVVRLLLVGLRKEGRIQPTGPLANQALEAFALHPISAHYESQAETILWFASNLLRGVGLPGEKPVEMY
jgi:hypothetical protein